MGRVGGKLDKKRQETGGVGDVAKRLHDKREGRVTRGETA